MTPGRQAARMAIAIAMAFSAGRWPAAQSPAPATTAAISGSVVDGATGRPIENAIVTPARVAGAVKDMEEAAAAASSTPQMGSLFMEMESRVPDLWDKGELRKQLCLILSQFALF